MLRAVCPPEVPPAARLSENVGIRFPDLPSRQLNPDRSFPRCEKGNHRARWKCRPNGIVGESLLLRDGTTVALSGGALYKEKWNVTLYAALCSKSFEEWIIRQFSGFKKHDKL